MAGAQGSGRGGGAGPGAGVTPSPWISRSACYTVCMLSARPVPAIIMLSAVVLVAACSGSEPTPPTASSTEPTEEGQPAAAATSTPSTPSAPPDIPSGTVVLFYRVTFGSNTENLRGSGYNITWETGEKAILRYIPAADRDISPLPTALT